MSDAIDVLITSDRGVLSRMSKNDNEEKARPGRMRGRLEFVLEG